MEDEGPVRKVLRANFAFERAFEQRWQLIGRRHDVAVGTLFLSLLAVGFAAWSLWTLCASMPLVALGVHSYRATCRHAAAAKQETDDRFEEYRTVLETTLAEDDAKRLALVNGHLSGDRDPVPHG